MSRNERVLGCLKESLQTAALLPIDIQQEAMKSFYKGNSSMCGKICLLEDITFIYDIKEVG